MEWWIRPAAEADYDALCALWREGDAFHRSSLPQVFRDYDEPARSRAYVLEILGNCGAALFVAEGTGGRVVGLLHVVLQRAPDMHVLAPRTFAVVDSIVVGRVAQRAGIGTALMERAAAWARERGARQVELTVWEFNSGARAFYERLGYRTSRRRMWMELERR